MCLVPRSFKLYKTGELKVTFAKSQLTPTNEGEVFDGPTIVKRIDLADLGEESKPTYIVEELSEV